MPSVVQEHIPGQYDKYKTLPWGPGVVIPFLPLLHFETRSKLCCGHLCSLLKAGVISASNVLALYNPPH